MGKPKILIISTGGTISSKYTKNQGYSPALTITEILSNFTNLEEIAEIETIQFCNVLSFELNPQNIFEIVNVAKEKLEKDSFDGIVVTLGTAAIEEASYLADLLWDIKDPIVFTGAMLNASEREWDGPKNVFHSILVAASKLAKNKGAMVCMAGEIHAARDVVKIHKTRLNAFVSLSSGPLGFVLDNERVIFYRAPLLRKTFNVHKLETDIEIIKIGIGTSSRILDFLITNNTKAIILEALPGGGGVTPEIIESIKNTRSKDTIFILTSRSPLGSAISQAGGGCGPADLFKLGIINGGDLTSVKIRILLTVILSLTKSKSEIRGIIYNVTP